MAINPHVARLFDYIEADKSPKDNVEHIPLNVGGAKFTVSYHLLQNGKAISTTIVPGTKIRMPVMACIDVPHGGFASVEANVLSSLPAEAKTKFKEANVYSFFDRKKFHFVAAPDLSKEIGQVQLKDNDVANGLWYTANGVGFKIGNEENAPAMYLSRYSKRLVGHYPDVLQWVQENPAPKSNVDSLLGWYRRLGAKFIEHQWHLLWRGVLYTGESVDRAAHDLGDLPDDIKSDIKDWPDDTRIDAYQIWSGKKFDTTSWAKFKGMEESKPEGLATIFHENLDDVYKHYREVVDRVVQSANVAKPT